MLSQLPHEIVVMIARCLNFYTKLNLAKTCRKLYTLLYDTVLLEELTIPRGRTLQVLSLFKNKSLDGSKVKLCYFDSLPNDQFLTELPIIFPNLTYPTAHQSFSRNLLLSFNTRNEGTRPPNEPYRNLYHSMPLEFVPEYQFKNLKRFTLFNFDMIFLLSPNYLHRLRSFTSLKSLILHESILGFHELEMIHANCTGIEYLEMYPVRSIIDDFRSDHLIEPADHLTSLTIVGRRSTYFLNCYFLEYVVQKYPNLKTLKFYLKDRMDHKKITKLSNIGSNSILSTVMTKLVNQIQSLHMESCLFEYIMDRTDLAPASIRDLGFYLQCSCYSKFFKSIKTSSFIQSLTSLTSLTLPLTGAMNLYFRRIMLPNVKHLFICHKTAEKNGFLTVKLDVLLYTYQNLESLEISHPHSIVSLGCINNSKHLSLRSIKFHVHTIEPQVTEYIKEFLPNVNRFELFAIFTVTPSNI